MRGGAPGTRETDLLRPDETIERIDAIVLSGGSAFGLDAPGGVQAWLREQGRGFVLGPVRVPIVPGAILFDLINGGDKDWGRFPPYRDLGYAATASARPRLRARHGRRRTRRQDGQPQGRARLGIRHHARWRNRRRDRRGQCLRQRHHWRRPAFLGGAIRAGGRVRRARLARLRFRPMPLRSALKGGVRENTTVALVATDATLTKAQANRLAMVAHDGLARAIYPVHTPLDGDTVFAAATGKRPAPDLMAFTELGAVAANVLARAVARGVYEATALPFVGA